MCLEVQSMTMCLCVRVIIYYDSTYGHCWGLPSHWHVGPDLEKKKQDIVIVACYAGLNTESYIVGSLNLILYVERAIKKLPELMYGWPSDIYQQWKHVHCHVICISYNITCRDCTCTPHTQEIHWHYTAYCWVPVWLCDKECMITS